MALDDVLHLSDLKLPNNVLLAIDPTTGDHNHPVVSIHMSKADASELATEEAAEEVIQDAAASDEEGSAE